MRPVEPPRTATLADFVKPRQQIRPFRRVEFRGLRRHRLPAPIPMGKYVCPEIFAAAIAAMELALFRISPSHNCCVAVNANLNFAKYGRP